MCVVSCECVNELILEREANSFGVLNLERSVGMSYDEINPRLPNKSFTLWDSARLGWALLVAPSPPVISQIESIPSVHGSAYSYRDPYRNTCSCRNYWYSYFLLDESITCTGSLIVRSTR